MASCFLSFSQFVFLTLTFTLSVEQTGNPLTELPRKGQSVPCVPTHVRASLPAWSQLHWAQLGTRLQWAFIALCRLPSKLQLQTSKMQVLKTSPAYLVEHWSLI